MKTKVAMMLFGAAVALAMSGCGSEETKASTEQKKEFLGGPMPKGFMQQHQAGMAPKGPTGPAAPPAAGGQ